MSSICIFCQCLLPLVRLFIFVSLRWMLLLYTISPESLHPFTAMLTVKWPPSKYIIIVEWRRIFKKITLEQLRSGIILRLPLPQAVQQLPSPLLTHYPVFPILYNGRVSPTPSACSGSLEISIFHRRTSLEHWGKPLFLQKGFCDHSTVLCVLWGKVIGDPSWPLVHKVHSTKSLGHCWKRTGH